MEVAAALLFFGALTAYGKDVSQCHTLLYLSLSPPRTEQGRCTELVAACEDGFGTSVGVGIIVGDVGHLSQRLK